MATENNSIIVIKPYIRGQSNSRRVIIRLLDYPSYLTLNHQEMAMVEELQKREFTVEGFLAENLSGQKGLKFKDAIVLLGRLHVQGFIENTSPIISDKLREMGCNINTKEKLRKIISTILNLVNCPLLSFPTSEIHSFFRFMGRVMVSWPLLFFFLFLLSALVYVSGTSVIPNREALFYLFDEPEILLLKVILAVSLCSSVLAFFQMAALSGLGARFVGGNILLTGGCLLRLAIKDDDFTMIPRLKMIQYHVFSLLLPWIMALAFWQMQIIDDASFTSVSGMMALTFGFMGMLVICPIYRSPLVKLAEGCLVQPNFHIITMKHLENELFRGFFRFKKQAQVKEQEHEGHLAIWIGIFAGLAILWLYLVTIVFADVFITSIPHLWTTLVDLTNPIRAFSAGAILIAITILCLVPLLRLVFIPLQNIVAAGELPLRRARRGIDKFYARTISPNDAVTAFLREIPIFSHLDTGKLVELTKILRYQSFGLGQNIIKQGERGDSFYVLAIGQAQVILKKRDGIEEVLDILNPGDSFGEIALIEHTARTATVRAMTTVKALLLDKRQFDFLFPEHGSDRAGLTRLIRQVKLVSESQAFSHLTPAQVRELLRNATVVNFEKGQNIIKEGDYGDAAYLVEHGQVVVQKGEEKIAILGRGDLVGAIALVKDIPRTAAVFGAEEGSCLKIGRETFLKICLSNTFVAMLVSDLSDRQLSELRAG